MNKAVHDKYNLFKKLNGTKDEQFLNENLPCWQCEHVKLVVSKDNGIKLCCKFHEFEKKDTLNVYRYSRCSELSDYVDNSVCGRWLEEKYYALAYNFLF